VEDRQTNRQYCRNSGSKAAAILFYRTCIAAHSLTVTGVYITVTDRQTDRECSRKSGSNDAAILSYITFIAASSLTVTGVYITVTDKQTDSTAGTAAVMVQQYSLTEHALRPAV
jgi:nitrate reductase gamma subunit